MAKFLRGNLICYISETEGRKKLKFGKLDVPIFFERKSSKKISDLNTLLRTYSGFESTVMKNMPVWLLFVFKFIAAVFCEFCIY